MYGIRGNQTFAEYELDGDQVNSQATEWEEAGGPLGISLSAEQLLLTGVENGIDKTSCAWHSNISVYGGLTDTGGNPLPTNVFDDEGKPTYTRVGQGWSAYMDQGSGTVFSSFTGDRPAAHRRQCVWTKDCVVVYENNKPLVRFRGSHASRRGLKLWMNASQGGLDYLRSLQWPLSDAGLLNSRVTLKRLTVKNVGF